MNVLAIEDVRPAAVMVEVGRIEGRSTRAVRRSVVGNIMMFWGGWYACMWRGRARVVGLGYGGDVDGMILGDIDIFSGHGFEAETYEYVM